MATEIQIKFIEGVIAESLADDPEHFLVQIKVIPGNNIKVFLDGDNGITIEKCIRINRILYKRLEEDAIFPGDDFSLEVSSPGVGEPLMMHRQYIKNIGRFVQVRISEGIETEGELKAVGEKEITIETISGKGKKLDIKQTTIPFDNIKSTTVQIKF